MCGRFTQCLSWAELHGLVDSISPLLNLGPPYNVASGQDVAAVRTGNPGSESRVKCGRRLAVLRCGLFPVWAMDPTIGHRLINVRSETVAERPSFRTAYRWRRCLIPVDGFYEWQHRVGTRQPWLFGPRDGAPFAFACLRDRWTVREYMPLTGSLAGREADDAIETCTILTTAANAAVAPVRG